MKNSYTSIFLCCCSILVFSCSTENEILESEEQGKTAISFAAVLNNLSSGREAVKQQLVNLPECGEDIPAFVELVVTSSGIPVAGTFQQPLKLKVMQDSGGIYFTEENLQLELDAGLYNLDYFRVLDENLQVIWIAPRMEAGEINFAGMVNSPLPLEIDLRAGTKKYINVDVICYDNRLVNYYGYLFFELQDNRAIKFCIFGNYCDETGRHADAVRYVVNVWKYSGNEAAPKGAIIHENIESGIIIEDDFENGISVTYAVPLCLALPDTPGQDQYFFEISLLDGVGYDAPDPIIRGGVITDDNVRSLFDGTDNLDYYHFREGNCNLADSPDLFDEVNGESPVAGFFLPALQSHYGPRGGVEWTHEYNGEGVLVKSMMYERFPYRLASEFQYSEHNEKGLPFKINRKSYIRENVRSSTVELTYSDDKINMMTTYDENGDFESKLLITNYDAENRITGSHSLSETDSFISRDVHQYDSRGRIEVSTTYTSEHGTGEEEIIKREENTYTSFGELHISRQWMNGVERMVEYFYRDDNTLRGTSSVTNEEEPLLEIIEFDENEVRNFVSVSRGVYRTDYISFFEDGSPHIVHSYHRYFLYQIITYNEDGSSEWKIIEEDDFTYRIEYKDASGNIYKTEYYTSHGDLISEE